MLHGVILNTKLISQLHIYTFYLNLIFIIKHWISEVLIFVFTCINETIQGRVMLWMYISICISWSHMCFYSLNKKNFSHSSLIYIFYIFFTPCLMEVGALVLAGCYQFFLVSVLIILISFQILTNSSCLQYLQIVWI